MVSCSQGQVLPREQLQGERGAKVRVTARKHRVCEAGDKDKDKRKMGSTVSEVTDVLKNTRPTGCKSQNNWCLGVRGLGYMSWEER